jgi:hypothetical protein
MSLKIFQQYIKCTYKHSYVCVRTRRHMHAYTYICMHTSAQSFAIFSTHIHASIHTCVHTSAQLAALLSTTRNVPIPATTPPQSILRAKNQVKIKNKKRISTGQMGIEPRGNVQQNRGGKFKKGISTI